MFSIEKIINDADDVIKPVHTCRCQYKKERKMIFLHKYQLKNTYFLDKRIAIMFILEPFKIVSSVFKLIEIFFTFNKCEKQYSPKMKLFSYHEKFFNFVELHGNWKDVFACLNYITTKKTVQAVLLNRVSTLEGFTGFLKKHFCSRMTGKC